MENAHDEQNLSHDPDRSGSAGCRRHGRFRSCVPVCDVGRVACHAGAPEHTDAERRETRRHVR